MIFMGFSWDLMGFIRIYIYIYGYMIYDAWWLTYPSKKYHGVRHSQYMEK